MNAYQQKFEFFVKNKLPHFYAALDDFYFERSGNRDSLSYFYNHFDRFQAMIDMCLKNNVSGTRLCELGSWYPYTTYYFKMLNDAVNIDLYDIIVRELKINAYHVDQVRLIDFNLCTEKFPKITYDLIILSEVLEHLPINQFVFEKQVIELMKKDSWLVVTYPLGGINAKDYELDFVDRDFERLQEDHVREYTEETTKLFFKDLKKIDDANMWYRAYGHTKVCLYQR